jgi:hypothetical protein
MPFQVITKKTVWKDKSLTLVLYVYNDDFTRKKEAIKPLNHHNIS